MSLDERLDHIEALLGILVERQTVKEHYEIEEFAEIVGKSCFTCREWCRLGRIRADKKLSGRGAYEGGSFLTPNYCVIKRKDCCRSGGRNDRVCLLSPRVGHGAIGGR